MSNVLIRVDKLSGEPLLISSTGPLTVWELKKRIKLSIGVPKQQQRLLVATRSLGQSRGHRTGVRIDIGVLGWFLSRVRVGRDQSLLPVPLRELLLRALPG